MANEIRLATALDDGDAQGIEMLRFGHLNESHLRTLFVSGTFDSATLKLQISPDSTDGIDGIWYDVTGADTITAKTVINVEFRAKWVRVSISGSVTAAALDAWLI